MVSANFATAVSAVCAVAAAYGPPAGFSAGRPSGSSGAPSGFSGPPSGFSGRPSGFSGPPSNFTNHRLFGPGSASYGNATAFAAAAAGAGGMNMHRSWGAFGEGTSGSSAAWSMPKDITQTQQNGKSHSSTNVQSGH